MTSPTGGCTVSSVINTTAARTMSMASSPTTSLTHRYKMATMPAKIAAVRSAVRERA